MNKKIKKRSEIEKEREERFLASASEWLSYWRANPHRFCEEYLGIKLKRFQAIIIYAMFKYPNFLYLAARGAGKTFLLAIFCTIHAILYPGSEIRIASKTRAQAGFTIGKITEKLIPSSPLLKLEVDKVIDSQSEHAMYFHNGSIISVVTSSDNGRGERAQVLICDEARMLNKAVVDSVLENYLKDPRNPPFYNLDEYADYPKEPTKFIYASSCWFQEHWLYRLTQTFVNEMSKNDQYFTCAIPYQLLVEENMIDIPRTKKQLNSPDFDLISWTMENESLFWGDNDGSFFTYGEIAKNRRIKYPFYPNRAEFKIVDEVCKLPIKSPNEKRIMAVDVALMSSTKHKNDASSITFNRMTRQKNGRYYKDITYIENLEGVRADTQALIIRRLINDFDVDYVAIDAKGAGLSIIDLLMSDITDPETGDIYEALSCDNNDDIASRCIVKNAPKKIWAIQGSAQFNSQCAIILKEALRQGEVRFLLPDFDIEEELEKLKGYNKLGLVDKTNLKLPYIHTSLLVQELIGLECEIKGSAVKLKEKSGARKDRFSSLSYNLFLAREIERGLRQKEANTQATGLAQIFKFRAPKN